MEHPSFTYIATQSVDYLGQTHDLTDTDIISSYKEICKQLTICQEKLHEEREKKGQKKLRKYSSHSKKLSQKAAQQSLQSQHEVNNNILNFSNQLKLHAEERHLIRIKNALWRRMGLSFCDRKENKLVSSKTSLECSSLYQRKVEQQKKCLTNAIQAHSSSYVSRYNRAFQNRRIQRKIRHASTNSYTLNYFSQLPRQNTNDLMIPSQPKSLMELISIKDDYVRYLTPISYSL